MLDWLMPIALGLLLAWLAVVAVLLLSRPSEASLREAMRILPDMLRLLRRLAGDPTVPKRAKVVLWLLLAYLASPIDLVPDFVPVLGYADDAIIVAAALRFAVRVAGVDRVREHWPGTEDGFAALARITRLPTA